MPLSLQSSVNSLTYEKSMCPYHLHPRACSDNGPTSYGTVRYPSDHCERFKKHVADTIACVSRFLRNGNPKDVMTMHGKENSVPFVSKIDRRRKEPHTSSLVVLRRLSHESSSSRVQLGLRLSNDSVEQKLYSL